jgi:hypothetical protein
MTSKILSIATLATILAAGTAHAQFYQPQPLPFQPFQPAPQPFLPPVQMAPTPRPFFMQPVPPPPSPYMVILPNNPRTFGLGR